MEHDYTKVVVQPDIPIEDMTQLEELVLQYVFENAKDGDGRYFYSSVAPTEQVAVLREDLELSLGESQNAVNLLTQVVSKALANQSDEWVELDLNNDLPDSYLYILQQIVARSKTLKYITLQIAFTCDKMRPGSIGGAAYVVLPTEIVSMSTFNFADTVLIERGLHAQHN
jgi:hypothetical protein